MTQGPGADRRRVSVVVPVLDDAPALRRLLARLGEVAPEAEVIVADGGSGDRPDVVARDHGAVLVAAPRGRGVQLNAGAAAARGDVVWFLHADSGVQGGAVDAMLRALEDPAVAGGAFRFRLAVRTWYAPLLDALVHVRSRWLHRPYGDQGIFVRARVFRELGGYRPSPVLEDVDFVRRLRRRGRIAVIDPPLLVSPRRYDRHGFLRVVAVNQALLAAHALGVAPSRLARWYPSAPERQIR